MNTIEVFANQTKPVNFYPAAEGKKAFAMMNVAENSEVGTEKERIATYYTIKAWDKDAVQLAEEDKLNDKHNKFYKIVGRLVTIKAEKNGKVYLNKEIHATKIELIYTPGVDVPKSKQEAAETAKENEAA